MGKGRDRSRSAKRRKTLVKLAPPEGKESDASCRTPPGDTSARARPPPAHDPVHRRISSALLQAHRATAACAIGGCVACAYKICAFDVCLDRAFVSRVPNVRPEMCPRIRGRTGAARVDGPEGKRVPRRPPLGLRPPCAMLTVGDGDFSYSVAVARCLDRFGGRQASFLLATSYEPENTVRAVYDAGTTATGGTPLEELTKRGGGGNAARPSSRVDVEVAFGVDATDLEKTVPRRFRSGGTAGQGCSCCGGRYHRIDWNFPCTAVASGKDGQLGARDEDVRLVADFVAGTLDGGWLCLRSGELHLAHKTKPPYGAWDIAGTVEEASGGRLERRGATVLDRAVIPPYVPRKALDRKSFPSHDALVYSFGWRKGANVLRGEGVAEGPTIQADLVTDNSNAEVVVDYEHGDDHEILPVTDALLERIRRIHLQLPFSR